MRAKTGELLQGSNQTRHDISFDVNIKHQN